MSMFLSSSCSNVYHRVYRLALLFEKYVLRNIYNSTVTFPGYYFRQLALERRLHVQIEQNAMCRSVLTGKMPPLPIIKYV